MRELPDKIEPNAVLEQMKNKQNYNRFFRNIHAPKFTELKAGGGLFKKFEWTADEYGVFLEHQRNENKQNRELIEKLHGKDFVPTSTKKSMKYENPFNAEDTDYLFPFFDEHDPYEAAQDEVRRTKWLEEAKRANPNTFKPFGKERSLLVAG